ncbi:MAG: hypothetical protein M3268_02605 [Acidobacteriota bacterium]|nr:hypothetical protein [Acidobacteriota bacterium]
MLSADFDANFVLWVFLIMSAMVLLAIVGFIIVGIIAFRKDGTTKAFVELFSRGDILRLLTVAGLLVVVIVLAFAKLIQGEVVASILSGVIGYVLGGTSIGKGLSPQKLSGGFEQDENQMQRENDSGRLSG